MQQATAIALSQILVGMEPWSRLGSSAAGLARTMMVGPADGARSWCLRIDGEIAGAFVVYDSWLMGPYLRRLVVLPPCQRQGLAQAAMAWWEADARQSGATNLWLCVSDFNVIARRLYETAGFRQAAVLEDLVADGRNEILMRKQLKPIRSL